VRTSYISLKGITTVEMDGMIIDEVLHRR
jgi:hypothetical protein